MNPFLMVPALILIAPGADEGTFALTRARLQAVNAGDVDAVMSLYEGGAEALLPDGRRVKGAALRQAWTDSFAKGKPKVELKEVTYVAGPDGVFAYGTLLVTREGQAPETFTHTEFRVRRGGRWVVRFEGRVVSKG